MDNCLVTEIRSQNEKCFLTCVYCSPSQNQDEFENFCTNYKGEYQILLNNINNELPLCSVATGDFNACCSRRWKNDTTNFQDQELDSLTSSARYNQIIDKSTHVTNNSMSCIGLTFRTNQSGVSNHGFDASIFDKCQLNIIYNKISISVPLPRIDVREVWDYKKANIENVKKTVSNFNYNKPFKNLSIDEKVEPLNKNLPNILEITFQTKKLNVTIGNFHGWQTT